jgi:type I site-specific restriction endonuclease
VEAYLTIIIALVAVALLTQAAVLVLTYLRLAKLDEETKALRQKIYQHSEPILQNVEDVTTTVRENSRLIFDDLSGLSHDARRQMEKVDHLTDEVADRLRGQIIRLDQLLNQALDNLELAGSRVRDSVTGPVREATAVLQGVKAAFDYLSARRARAASKPRRRADEELFI